MEKSRFATKTTDTYVVKLLRVDIIGTCLTVLSAVKKSALNGVLVLDCCTLDTPSRKRLIFIVKYYVYAS